MQREQLVRAEPVTTGRTLPCFCSYQIEPKVYLAWLHSPECVKGAQRQNVVWVPHGHTCSSSRTSIAHSMILLLLPTSYKMSLLTSPFDQGVLQWAHSWNKTVLYCMWHRMLTITKMWAFLPSLSLWSGCPTMAIFPKLILHLVASCN